MKVDYTVENKLKQGQSFILVSNYKYSNNVVNQGFYSEKLLIGTGSFHSVGIWKIKQLKNQ